MKARIPIAVLASGRGSNFDAILSAIRQGELHAEIRALISDNPNAPALKKAESAGIKTISLPWPEGADPSRRREEHERKMIEALREFSPRFLVMAGYMRVVTPLLIEEFRSERGYSRIVNIHPSLLPSFPGVHAYARAFDHGAKVAGVTVHLVEDVVDSGPICAQESFSIADCRSAEEVEERGLKIEHRLFPQTLSWILPEAFEVEGRSGGRLCVRAR